GRPCSWRSGWVSRSCWRASPASGRPRPRRRWPARWTHRWSGSSATRAYPPPKRCTSGTTRASCWPSGWPRPRASASGTRTCSPGTTCCPGPCWPRCCTPARGPRPAVLLIDEIDRADDEFEAFLFELLAESTVTIPELGTQQAVLPPITVLTSNRTRDLHDALKRRCLYHWITYPDTARVTEIIRRRVPPSGQRLAGQIATAVQRLRALDLTKPPGISEAIAWAFAVSVYGGEQLDVPVASQTLSTVLKYPEDEETVRLAGLARVVAALD